MKKIILICIIITYAYASNAQLLQDTMQNRKLTDKEPGMQYLKKGKNQKKLGTVLATGGLVIGTIGMAVGLSGFAKGFDWSNPQSGESEMSSGSALMVAGAVMIVAGVPFIIAGSKNKKRGELLLGTSNIMIAPQVSTKKIFSVGVAINI